jgi:hypothetical protein
MEQRFPWRSAAIPVVAIALLAIYPQLSLWLGQGSGWKGSYAVSNYDEVAYSAYLNALIDGKPRKYNPFLARTGEAESLYSIQAVPAYSIAFPARLFGLSASTTFIIAGVLTAAAAAFFLFFLFWRITGDDLTSVSGTLVVLCLGCLAAYQGELRQILEGRLLVDFLPFLRRYQPAFAFPILLAFCGAIWRSLNSDEIKSVRVSGFVGGVCFVFLIFSYFYLWTAAAAWLVCASFLFFVFRKGSRRNVFECLAITSILGIVALVPYFLMLAKRDAAIDSVQLLSFTHAPELASPVMMIGLVVAAAVFGFARAGKIVLSSPITLVSLSFAITPIVLLNQQIVTGRSLQPVHYEIFVGNYFVLISIVLVGWQISSNLNRETLRKALVYVGLAAFGWGLVETSFSTARAGGVAKIRDESMPAISYIQEQEKSSSGSVTVHATNFVTADFVPTVATVRTLWNPHSSSAGDIDVTENRRLFYLYLYYSGFNGSDLSEALRANSFEVTAAIFGSERALPSLGKGSRPITQQEIVAEVAKYGEFSQRFDQQTAQSPTLSYIIVPAESEPDFSNLDRWYSRDAGQVFGLFKVYKLQPRS